MSRPRSSWHPLCCAVVTILAITMGMLMDGSLDLAAAALLIYPVALFARALFLGLRKAPERCE